MQRGVFRKPGTQAVYNVRAPDSLLALRSPLVSVQSSDLVKRNNSFI